MGLMTSQCPNFRIFRPKVQASTLGLAPKLRQLEAIFTNQSMCNAISHLYKASRLTSGQLPRLQRSKSSGVNDLVLAWWFVVNILTSTHARATNFPPLCLSRWYGSNDIQFDLKSSTSNLTPGQGQVRSMGQGRSKWVSNDSHNSRDWNGEICIHLAPPRPEKPPEESLE